MAFAREENYLERFPKKKSLQRLASSPRSNCGRNSAAANPQKKLMKTYTLRVIGRSVHATVLAARCAIGGPGETLVREGVSKEAWNRFMLRVVMGGIAKKIPEKDILDVMNLLDAGNASASRQTIKDLILVTPRLDKEGKQMVAEADSVSNDSIKKGDLLVNTQTVEKYWESIGGAKAAVDLTKLNW